MASPTDDESEKENEEDDDEPVNPKPPKRRKKEKEVVVESSDEEPEDNPDSYDKNEDISPEKDVSVMTPEQAIAENRCPFCHGDLNIGASPDKKTGSTCQWVYLPPNRQSEFIVKAHLTVLKDYKYPNEKPTCNHGIPMKAQWIYNISKFEEKDGKLLEDCIFFVCEIGVKDDEGRAPCDKVILCNMADPKKRARLESVFKKAVLKKKIATSKCVARFAYNAKDSLKRMNASGAFLRKFGARR